MGEGTINNSNPSMGVVGEGTSCIFFFSLYYTMGRSSHPIYEGTSLSVFKNYTSAVVLLSSGRIRFVKVQDALVRAYNTFNATSVTSGSNCVLLHFLNSWKAYSFPGAGLLYGLSAIIES